MNRLLANCMRVCFGADRHSRRLYLALIVAILLYCPLLFSGFDRYGRHDWDQFTFRYETPRLALLRDHQLPLWNPYVNGGTVLLAHPDSPFPSPWYLLVLGLGTPLGLRVQVVLFMMLGTIGMAALLRRWQIPTPGCFVGGVVFMMSAHFALHIAAGHLEWCVLGLMPWVVLCLLRFSADLRFVIVAAVLLASVLMFGSVYIMAVYMPFLSIWVALESIRTRSPRLAFGWVGTLALVICLSAVKLLPQLEFASGRPRDVDVEGVSPAALALMFLEPRQAAMYRATREMDIATYNLQKPAVDRESRQIYARLNWFGVKWHLWHEYGAYITYLGLALAVLGFAVSWRSQWPLYAAGAAAFIAALGNGSSVNLWALLQRLPLYGSLQAPSRFLSAVVLVLAVAAAYGLAWLCRRTAGGGRPFSALIRYAIPMAIYLELAVMGWNLFGDIFVYPPIELPRHEQFATRYKTLPIYFPGMLSYVYPALSSNSGVLEGYENIAVTRGDVRTVDDAAYRGEAYLDSSRGAVSIREWTMSRVKVAFRVNAADRLVLNQNYFTGWRAIIHGSDGSREQRAAADGSGLVSVAVRPNDREVEFYYRPDSFLVGAWISGIVLIACVLVLIAKSALPLVSRARDPIEF